MIIHKYSGETITITASQDLATGDAVLAGTKWGVAIEPIASGAQGQVAVEGTYELPCASGVTAAGGAAAYIVSGAATTTSGSGAVAAGIFAAPVTSGATMCVVKLC